MKLQVAIFITLLITLILNILSVILILRSDMRLTVIENSLKDWGIYESINQ